MKKYILPALLLVAMNGVLLTGCYNDNEQELYPNNTCSTSSVTYSGNVKAVMQANCAISGCHTVASSAAAGGIELESYTGLKTIVTNGKLLGAINHLSGFSAMPKNASKLSDCTLSQIKKWVDDGALNN